VARLAPSFLTFRARSKGAEKPVVGMAIEQERTELINTSALVPAISVVELTDHHHITGESERPSGGYEERPMSKPRDEREIPVDK
jgi:hypothetical protein